MFCLSFIGSSYLATKPYYLLFFQAAVICGCVGVIAEVSGEALRKRHQQGWVVEVEDDVDRLVRRIRQFSLSS